MSTVTTQMSDSPFVQGAGPHEYLAFNLGAEEYGIDIHAVQELRGYEAVTRIANSPAYIKGVVNLRGVIVPIIDMRLKLNLGEPSYDQFTVVIIINLKGRMMGMVVDSVSDVIQLTQEQIKQAPDMGTTVNSRYVKGLGIVDERMLILADIEKLMTDHDVISTEQLAA